MIDSEVMQAASDDHDQIRKVVFGIPQNIFYDPRALDARNGVLHLDSDSRNFAIALFLLGR